MKESVLGFLGPCGTHSEAVAIYLKQQRERQKIYYKLQPFMNIHEAMLAVDTGKIAKCIVPVENSLEGSVNITLDTLAHVVDLTVTKEIIWTVHNQLMVKDIHSPIERIVSHAQPLAQCHNYIKDNYHQAELIPVSSTAQAAAMVSQAGSGYAAIATARAGELYGLNTIASDIQDDMSNCTRFYLLAKRSPSLLRGYDKTSLICQINGSKAGSLCEVLWEFAKRDVNLNSIESRPAKTCLGQYIFFLSLEGAIDSVNVQEAIKAVKERSLWLKNLGSFDVVKIDNKKQRKDDKL